MTARRILTPCLEPGCPELVPRGTRRCAQHHHEFEVSRGRRKGSRSAGRDHASHKRFAREVKKRDGHRCMQCGATEGLRAHHIVALHKGGTDDPSNGVTLCARCDRLADRHAR